MSAHNAEKVASWWKRLTARLAAWRDEGAEYDRCTCVSERPDGGHWIACAVWDPKPTSHASPQACSRCSPLACACTCHRPIPPAEGDAGVTA